MEELKQQNVEILEIIKPMAEIFNGASFAGRLTSGILKGLAVLGAGVAATGYLWSLIHRT